MCRFPFVPNSVTSIGDTAFNDCTSLASVTIGSSVTSIGSEAFESCTSLASVTIPDSVTSIGSGAFSFCTSLASVTIGTGVTSIGSNAFYNCRNLASVTFQGTIASANFASNAFDSSSNYGYIGDLRTKFYATDSSNGTPGTYTRPNTSSLVWTKQ